MKPLIQLFEVVGILVRVFNKSELVVMILVTIVANGYIVAILVTTALDIASFGGRFEVLDFLSTKLSIMAMYA